MKEQWPQPLYDAPDKNAPGGPAAPAGIRGPTGIVRRNENIKRDVRANDAVDAAPDIEAVPDTLESLRKLIKRENESGHLDEVEMSKRVAKFCETQDPTSMDLKDVLRIKSIINRVSHIGGRAGRMASAISQTGIREQEKRFNIVTDAAWDRAIAEGRALVSPEGEHMTRNRKKELQAEGYQFATNSRRQLVSLKPDSPEALALIEAYGKEESDANKAQGIADGIRAKME